MLCLSQFPYKLKWQRLGGWHTWEPLIRARALLAFGCTHVLGGSV